jgi:hypothetical protein
MHTSKMLRAVLVYSYHKRRQEDAEQNFDSIRQIVLQKTSSPNVLGHVLAPHIAHLRSTEEQVTRARYAIERLLHS